jgi:hypothetical protein
MLLAQLDFAREPGPAGTLHRRQDSEAVDQAHVLLGDLSLGLEIALAVLAAVGWIRRRLQLTWIDRGILLLEAVIALAILTGAARFAGGQRPPDGLHLLYAALALGAVPLGRLWASTADVEGRREPRPAFLLVAAIVAIGVTIRLFQTG